MPFDVYFCMCVGLYLYSKTNNVSIFKGRALKCRSLRYFGVSVSKEVKLQNIIETILFTVF